MNDLPQRLPFHEWVIVFLLVILMFTLSFVTYMKQQDALPHLTEGVISDKLKVSIEGAIKKPGEYTLKQEARLGELLDLVEPFPEADLRRLKRNKKIRDGQHLYVPHKEMITIHLEGAIANPGPQQVVKGTRLNELKAKVTLKENADENFFQKKRRLKDQEIVIVPKHEK